MTVKVKALSIKTKPSKVSFKKFFSTNEQKVLENYHVKKATDKVLEAWGTHNKSGEQLAVRLEAARKAMVTGNSPKSLFSKWLKFVGIPRATAYWTLARYGKKSTHKQPSVKQLVIKKASLEASMKSAKGEAKDTLKKQLAAVTSQLIRRREVIENRIKALRSDLMELVKGIAAFGESDEVKPVAAKIADTMVEIGFAPAGVTGPHCEFNSDGTVEVSVPKKPPTSAYGPAAYQARA